MTLRAKCLLCLAMAPMIALVVRGAKGPQPLRVLGEDYPRAFFFRSAEGMAANENMKYERWEKSFERLMGIEGKVLDEEVPGRSKRNIEFFTRFKQRHPDQLVLLHYNGNARDPREQEGKFFAGHWLYYDGSKVLSDLPARDGETEIRVSNARLFKTGIGRYGDGVHDIGLFELDAKGNPNWNACEQVQLVSVDPQKGLIRVKRGMYGTKPRAFASGKAYAAAHRFEGPWGGKSHILWAYNYATDCPRDEHGRNCVDVLVDDLAAKFAPGGPLATFDGLEFDVLKDKDKSLPDGGLKYRAGVLDFLKRLHQKIGEDKFVMADGWSRGNQRAFGILNGIESEGWPSLSDYQVRDWSGGLNRQYFWVKNSKAPVFNYINHKFNINGEKPGQPGAPAIPPATNRLVFAGAMFTDSAICYSMIPATEEGELIGIWDELWMGRQHRVGWLGKPRGPAVHLASKQKDLLGGIGAPPRQPLLARFQGEGVKFGLDETGMKIAAGSSNAEEMQFKFTLPANGPDLWVAITMRAAPLGNSAPEVGRQILVGSKSDASLTWVNQREFQYSFYLPGLKSDKVDLEFNVEGGEPLWITRITAHAHPDTMYREFEHGLVLANPSPRPYAFDLGRMFPGSAFRRLQGSAKQDPVTNDGSPVQGSVQLGPHDGLFLIR